MTKSRGLPRDLVAFAARPLDLEVCSPSQHEGDQGARCHREPLHEAQRPTSFHSSSRRLGGRPPFPIRLMPFPRMGEGAYVLSVFPGKGDKTAV
jgi:hypothetical protein